MISYQYKLINMSFTFIDLFAGIGGMRLGFERNGGECVFSSEWDENCQKTYQLNFGEWPRGDISKISLEEIPCHDVLVAGFPCQPFSQAGFKKGFEDTRGTLFFTIAAIIKEKQPQAFFLENVRGLLTHNNGNTFTTIRRVITEELGYSFFWKIIKASDFGLPQYRPRLFMVGFQDKSVEFQFPEPEPLQKTMTDIWGAPCAKKIGYTLRCGGRGSGVADRRNWDCYLVDGQERQLTPKEGKAMQGFPEDFCFPVSETQAMKQLGNSVAVPAVQAVARNIVKYLSND